MTPGIILEIGGIPVNLQTCDLALRDAIQEHYTAFVTKEPSSEPIDLSIQVAAEGFPDRATLPALAHLHVNAEVVDGRWRFERCDFRMEWSPERHTGWMQQARPEWAPLDAALRMLHSVLASQSGGFLLHAASAILSGSGYIFTGVSGAGKSTISSLLPNGSTRLTDEISYVLPSNGGYRAFGTPFVGDLGILGEPASGPLKAVYVLAKGKENKVERIPNALAPAALLRNVLFFARSSASVVRVFGNVCRLVELVPVYRLTFVPTPEVWKIIL